MRADLGVLAVAYIFAMSPRALVREDLPKLPAPCGDRTHGHEMSIQFFLLKSLALYQLS